MTKIPDLPEHVVNTFLTPLEREIYCLLKSEDGVNDTDGTTKA